MIRIHREYEAFRTGSLKMLCGEKNILAYGRFLDEDQFVIVLNKGEELAEVHIPVWLAEVPVKGAMRRLMYTYENGYTTEHEEYQVVNGEIVVNMGSHSALVLKTLEY